MQAGAFGQVSLTVVAGEEAGDVGHHGVADVEEVEGAAFGAGGVAAGEIFGAFMHRDRIGQQALET